MLLGALQYPSAQQMPAPATLLNAPATQDWQSEGPVEPGALICLPGGQLVQRKDAEEGL